jgi:hypothetical protein
MPNTINNIFGNFCRLLIFDSLCFIVIYSVCCFSRNRNLLLFSKISLPATHHVGLEGVAVNIYIDFVAF